MKSQRTTPSQENYIEWVYRLSADGPVRVGQLAEHLGVTRPSATRAIALLTQKGLVEHEPYGDIRLTQEGTALGRAIVRRDECLTKLLVSVLDMSPEEADPEVHRLEHVLSSDVVGRLEVLVRFALSSEAWVKRLHHRIGQACEDTHEEGPFQPGRTDIHRGITSEKR